jgi:hypothetical protein
VVLLGTLSEPVGNFGNMLGTDYMMRYKQVLVLLYTPILFLGKRISRHACVIFPKR